MQQTKTIEFPWVTVYCSTTTAVFVPLSPWMSAPEIQYLRCPFELAAREGMLQAQAAYQTANDPRSPDAAVGFGTTKAAEGVVDPTDFTDVGTTFKAKRLFRFGFLCSTTSGTALSLARVSGSLLKVSR